MGRSGVIRADGQPYVSGTLVFPAQQRGCRAGVDTPVPEDGFRRDAHRRQCVEVYRVDLERPEIPCAVDIAQRLARAAPFRGKDAEQGRRGQAAGKGGLCDAGRRQRARLRNRDAGASGGVGRARQQAQTQAEQERSHLRLPFSLTMNSPPVPYTLKGLFPPIPLTLLST